MRRLYPITLLKPQTFPTASDREPNLLFIPHCLACCLTRCLCASCPELLEQTLLSANIQECRTQMGIDGLSSVPKNTSACVTLPSHCLGTIQAGGNFQWALGGIAYPNTL